LENRLKKCRNVITLGMKPQIGDYGARAARLIHDAKVIYYPGALYAQLFTSMGKTTFPGPAQYWYAQDKIRQTALFTLLQLPHPRTRVFYGPKQLSTVNDFFRYPFVAKIPRGSARGRGVFLIRSQDQFRRYCSLTPIAYVQQYLPGDRDIRVVVVKGKPIHAYWRLAPGHDFRTNLALGGRIGLEPVPDQAVALALTAARSCGFDDVGIDILPYGGQFYLLEANMKYGLEGFRQAGIDYIGLMEELIAAGEI
jgi:ribosomal protein S6--L-glutamate ligase